MSQTYSLQDPKAGFADSGDAAVAPAGAGKRDVPAVGKKVTRQAPPRLCSLDAYRGFVMLVLAASGFGIAAFAALPEDARAWRIADYQTWQRIGFHFEHPAWRSNFRPAFLGAADDANTSEFLRIGVSFWDLIQPAFMFIVGVAMPFSYAKRSAVGQSQSRRVVHALWRALVLVLMGVFLYSLRADRTNWVFTNVLAQIGLGYFFVYLLLGRKLWVQLTALAAVLGGYWFFMFQHDVPEDYDYAAVEASAEEGEVYTGRFSQWSKNANAAHAFDRWFLNLLRDPDDELLAEHGIDHDADDWAPQPIRNWFFANPEPFLFSSGGYQTLNFIPSIGTMLLGVMCGQLLLTSYGRWKKIGILLAAGLLCLVLGLLAGEFVCPIVKRIWTPSWTLFSGAYVIWMLALFYLLFDVLPLKWLAFPLVVVGMNSIVMYFMGQLIRPWTIHNVVETHFTGILQSMFGTLALDDDVFGRIILPTAAAVVFWLIALWLYRRRIFIRV